MQKCNLGLKWVPLMVCFSFISFCVMIVPKIGITNDTGSVSATASAGQTGQNWFWTTYKTEAMVTVTSAAEQDDGVYQMRVKVTGKIEKTSRYVGLGGGTTVNFSSSASCAFTDDLDDDKTYRVWGSGNDDFSISASSSGDITGEITSASGGCTAHYPQQP